MRLFCVFLGCLFFSSCGGKKIVILPDGATPYLVQYDEREDRLKCMAENDEGDLFELDPKDCHDRMAFSKGQVFRIFERLKTCPEVQEFVSEAYRLNMKKNKRFASK